MRLTMRLLVTGVSASLFAFGAVAQSLTPQQQAEARTKVETAVALADIARAEGDGEALAVAARLLAAVGPVVKRGEPAGQSTSLYSIADLAAEARGLGADPAKTDALAGTSRELAPTYCYWYYNCDSNNNCQWQYIC